MIPAKHHPSIHFSCRFDMSTEILRDARFKTIGHLETKSNGDQVLRDAHFSTLGYYDSRHNITQDAHFRTIGRGNILASLLR